MSKLKSVLLGTLTAIAGGTSSEIVQAQGTTSTEQQAPLNKDVRNEKIQPTIVTKRIVRVGPQPIIYYPSTGIPPKIYGQNYVRRGTHKRTNK